MEKKGKKTKKIKKKIIMNKGIFFVSLLIISLFFIELASAETMAVVGISPINQEVCLSSHDSKIINYTVSSSSNESQTFLFTVLNISWIYTNGSVLMGPRSAIQLPIYIIPRNVPDGNYTTKVWFCRQETQPNFTGYLVRNCLEGNIDVEVAERCRMTQENSSAFFFIMAIVALIVILYMIYLKLRGK
jgi:hypothetical protein